MRRFGVGLCFGLVFSACATLPTSQSAIQLEDVLYTAELEGIRWGIIVTDMNGQVLFEHNADQRFSPASNTKLVTTAAGFHWQQALNTMGPDLATRVVLLHSSDLEESSNLVLVGRGDPQVEDKPDCQTRCLKTLADQVAQSGIRHVQDIIADDSWFPEQNWVQGWSWEDLQEHYGTAISALSVNKNIAELTIRPSNKVDDVVQASWRHHTPPMN